MSVPSLRQTLIEMRLAARTLARHRTFCVTAVLSLGLAIALNTTMYGVIDAMLNPRRDFARPEQLRSLEIWGDFHGKVDAQTRAELLRSGVAIFKDLTSYRRASNWAVSLEHARQYRQGGVAYVAPNVFRVLGIRPSAGRPFTDDDYTAASAPIAISEGLAKALFPDGDSPIGAVIDVDGSPHPVIGVVGKWSQPGPYDVWMLPPSTLPIWALPANIVRLRDGVSAEQVEAQLGILSNRFAQLSGEDPKDVAIRLRRMVESQFHLLRFHYALLGAVVAVLLIACGNLANLQIARGLGRSRELALRTALGATRRDLVRQLFLESGLIGFAGLVVGVLFTLWGIGLLAAHIPPSVGQFVIEPRTSWRLFAFAVAASLVCMLLIGLLPALKVSRVDPNDLLKSGAGTGSHRKNRNMYSLLIAVEVGLALTVLSGTAILIRSAAAVESVDVGYDILRLTQGWLINRGASGSAVRYVDAQNQILSRVHGLSDVIESSVVMRARTTGNRTTMADSSGEHRELLTPMYEYAIVSPSYFRTLQIPIVQGRDFTDGITSEGELVIDEATAHFLWPNGRALGGMIKLGSDSSHAPWVRVIGVVKRLRSLEPWSFHNADDVYAHGLGAMYYRPAATDSFVARKDGYAIRLVVRSAHDPERMPITLRREFAGAYPFALLRVEPLEQGAGLRGMRQSYAFVARVFIVFAALAVALAALGIYGIVAHSVAERRRELGVRIALGANTRQILRAVLREGLAVALAGVAVGLLCTKYTMVWLRAFSFEDDQYDVLLYACMGLALFVVTLMAALGPAIRATRIDPVDSLRAE